MIQVPFWFSNFVFIIVYNCLCLWFKIDPRKLKNPTLKKKKRTTQTRAPPTDIPTGSAPAPLRLLRTYIIIVRGRTVYGPARAVTGAVALLPLGRLVFDLFSSFGLFLERAVFRRILLNLFILNCFAS